MIAAAARFYVIVLPEFQNNENHLSPAHKFLKRANVILYSAPPLLFDLKSTEKDVEKEEGRMPPKRREHAPTW